MSLEAALDANTAAMKELTAALAAGKAAPTKADAKSSKASKPTITIDQITALAKEARSKIGPDAYKAIVKKVANVDALKDVPPEKLDALAAALTEARDAESPGEDDDDV